MDKLNFLEIYEEEHLRNRISYSQIREKYKIPRETWDYWIRKKFHKKADLRKHPANDIFFSIIDSEIKAYLLGFLYADGYLAKDGRMGIRLAIKDEYMIKLIQKYICPNSPIEYINNQNIKRMPQVSIRWKSNIMYEDLKQLGFCVDKTHKNSDVLQKIPYSLKRHFIRGYTDGDGNVRCSIVKGKNCKKIAITWSNGSEQILKDIKNYFSTLKTLQLKSVKNYYLLCSNVNKSTYIIVKHLYENSTFFLERKKQNAKEIIDYYNSRNTEVTN